MTKPEIGQDEARRKLARSDDVDIETLITQLRSMSAAWAIYSDEKGLASGAMDQAARIIAALRSDPASGAEEMEDRIDAMEDALHDIVRWSEAYPLTVFPEPDLKKARALLEAGGVTLDSISAYCMRHVVEGVGKIARRALPAEQKGGGE